MSLPAYSLKTTSVRPVRGILKIVDASYPADGHEFLSMNVRAGIPTLEARSGPEGKTLQILGSPNVFGGLYVDDAVNLASGALLVDPVTGVQTRVIRHGKEIVQEASTYTEADIETKNVIDLGHPIWANAGYVHLAIGENLTKIDAGATLNLPRAADNVGRRLLVSILNQSGFPIAIPGCAKLGKLDDAVPPSLASGKAQCFDLVCVRTSVGGDVPTWYWVSSF